MGPLRGCILHIDSLTAVRELKHPQSSSDVFPPVRPQLLNLHHATCLEPSIQMPEMMGTFFIQSIQAFKEQNMQDSVCTEQVSEGQETLSLRILLLLYFFL